MNDTKLKIGDKVRHILGVNGIQGIVLDIRDDPQGYKYKIRFEDHEGTVDIDWFKSDPMVLVS